MKDTRLFMLYRIFMTLLILFILAEKAALQGSIGYFSDAGQGTKGDSSCKTCNSSTSCLAGEDYMFLNQTTGLCQTCLDSEYYDATKKLGRTCDNVGDRGGAYQLHGFQGNTGKFYDLDTLACVDSGTSQQRQLSGEQVHNNSYGRSLDFYIDPSSNEILELGTIDYPFKNLMLPFIEILNFHSHSNATINIYMQERSYTELMIGYVFMININQVNLLVYSNTTNNPDKSTILITDSNINIYSTKTLFNLLASTTLNLAIQSNMVIITNRERSQLSTSNIGFIVDRSGFKIRGFDIITNYSNFVQDRIIIKSIYAQDKLIEMSNLSIQGYGSIFESIDPLNFLAQNLNIDYYRMSKGFIFTIRCNNTNSSIKGQITFDNITAYDSQQRTLDMDDSFIYYGGTNNFTLINSNLDIYSFDTELFPPVEIGTLLNCNPNDNSLQTIVVNSTIFTLSQSESLDRNTRLLVNILETHSRSIEIIIASNSFIDVYENTKRLIEIFATNLTTVRLYDTALTEASSSVSIIYISNAKTTLIDALTFENITKFGNALLDIEDSGYVYIDNLSINQCSSEPESSLYYLQISSLGDDNYVNINRISFTNTILEDRKGISLVTTPNFTLTNSVFTNLIIGNENSFIQLAVVNGLNINNCTFSQMKSGIVGDNLDIIFEITSLDASSSDNLIINNIKVTQSEVAFLYLNRIENTESYSKQFTISNFVYSNSSFNEKTDLIHFTQMETDDDFLINLENITFSDISYVVKGNLLLLEQQVINGLTIKNLKVTNIKYGYIIIQASNSQNTDLPGKVAITNLTTDNVNSGFQSFINIYENSIVEIRNSLIENGFTYESGGFLRAGYRKAQVTIYNSQFRFNAAADGGVFLVESDSVIKLYNSTINQNFAVNAGVIKAKNNGDFEFYSTNIFSNLALSLSVLEVFDVASTPIISQCQIYSNKIESKANIITYISNSLSCGSLCWLKDEYNDYLLDHLSLLDQAVSAYAIQVISGNLEISSKTVIYDQSKVLNCFVAIITVKNLTMSNNIFNGVGFQITASTAYFNDITISNATTQTSASSIIQTSLNAMLNVDGISYISSKASLINLLSSHGNISRLNILLYSGASYVIGFDQTTNATTNNWNFTGASSSGFILISASNSYIHSMTNLRFISGFTAGIYGTKSTINSIDRLYATGLYLPVVVILFSTINLSNSTIDNTGLLAFEAGAFAVYNTNFAISGCTFTGNRGRAGGAIYTRCPRNLRGYSSITDTVFINNQAGSEGGAISYDIFRPIISNLTFINNTAPLGNDISSYPVRIVNQGTISSVIEITDVPSGQEVTVDFKLVIVDADDQVSTTTNGGTIAISALDKSASILGGGREEIINGVASFKSLTFKAAPGAKNIKFSLSSSKIDSSIIKKEYGTSSIQEPLLVSFRYCQPGEISRNNECEIGQAGTYSLEWNSTKCYQGMDNAECLGGTQIYVDKGYWRSSSNSTALIEGLREDACNGGYEPDNENPINGADGYTGVLCTECEIINGEKFERLSNFEGSKCPNIIFNALRIVGLVLLVSLFFIVLIVVAIRKRKESQQSVLLRILANYLQLLTAALSFDMKFPKIVTEVFYPIQRIGNSSEAFLSIDGFLRDTELKAFAPSNAIFKLFLTGILPLVLITFAGLIWGLLYFCKFKVFKQYKRNIIVTTVVLIFLMHPMLTKVGLEIFQGVKVNENEYKVRIDLAIGCFSWEHMKWAMLFSLPILLIWVIGSPLLVLIILGRNRHSLQKWRIQKYFLLLYQGLRDKVFYWEFINTIRKLSMVVINVFMSTLPIVYSAIVAVIILIGLVRLQMKMDPYKLDLNNKLEIDAIVTGSATLFGGVLFTSDDSNLAALVLFILLVIIFLNVKFLMFWGFGMSFTFAGKYKTGHSVFMILAVATFRRKLGEDMLKEASISYNNNENDDNNDEKDSISKKHKKQINSSLNRSKKLKNAKNKRQTKIFTKKNSRTKSRLKQEDSKQVAPRSTTKFDNTTTQQIMDNDNRGKAYDVGKLVIMEEDESSKFKKSHNQLAETFALNIQNHEDAKSEDSMDLFYVKRMPKGRKFNLDDVDNSDKSHSSSFIKNFYGNSYNDLTSEKIIDTKSKLQTKFNSMTNDRLTSKRKNNQKMSID